MISKCWRLSEVNSNSRWNLVLSISTWRLHQCSGYPNGERFQSKQKRDSQEEMLWQIVFRDAGFILLVDVLEEKSSNICLWKCFEKISKIFTKKAPRKFFIRESFSTMTISMPVHLIKKGNIVRSWIEKSLDIYLTVLI